MQERVNHAPVRGGRNGALSNSPSSWSASNAGGGVRYSRRLMEKSRLGFENVDLKDSIDLANGDTEETIHNSEEAEKGGKMQLLILEGHG
jgi:hypothetical protein